MTVDKRFAPNYLKFLVEITNFQPRKILGPCYCYPGVTGLKKTGDPGIMGSRYTGIAAQLMLRSMSCCIFHHLAPNNDLVRHVLFFLELTLAFFAFGFRYGFQPVNKYRGKNLIGHIDFDRT